jgi:hypothetical protein
MGYTTDFSGSLSLSRPTTEVEKNYLDKFSDTRRMKRDVEKLHEMFKGEHGNPFAKTREEIYGVDGEYFVGGLGSMGQTNDASVINQNFPPGQTNWVYDDPNGQPGLWCQWVLTDDGTELQWDGGEKFYNYTEWLKYLINHFFEKWGIKLNGVIEWVGEDSSDRGIIVVKNNKVKVYEAQITYPGYGEDEDEE